MESWEARLIDEHAELHKKVIALRRALHQELFGKHRPFAVDQLASMEKYLEALSERIKLL